MSNINIKYIDKELEKIGLQQIQKGNWIDVRACSMKINGKEYPFNNGTLHYKKGDELLIGLGFAMQLPEGYGALVCPRSSTYKNYGVIQVNSMGIIDTTYCGNNDIWFVPFKALRDGSVTYLDRVAQFRIIESMGKINFTSVNDLGNVDRGSYGSTGVK